MADPLQLAQAAKSYQDINNDRQLQQLQQGLLKQQALTGANTYATQVISGALPGGQQAYDQAKQHLAQQGVDVSNWAPDVQTGAQQAVAAKLSQSPLGPLIDAQIKQQQANAATAGVNGTMAPGPQPIGGGMLGNMLSGAANSVVPGASAFMPPQQPAAPQMPQGAPAQAPLDSNAVISQASRLPQVSMDNTPSNAPLPMPPANGISAPKFVPPDVSGLNPKTANEVIQRAFEQYKADPNYIAASAGAKSAAEDVGKNVGEASKMYNIMQSNLPQALDRFKAMREAAQNANFGIGTNDEGTGLKQQLSDQLGNDTSMANNTLLQKSAQSLLPEIGPVIAQTGGRGNMFMERMAAQASGLRLSAPPAAKQQIIDGLENTYISNLKATAAQLRANGQPAMSDAEIDQAVQATKQNNPIAASNAANTGSPATAGPKMGTVQDGYLFMGGNPADQSSWKKVK